jgi:hypothetical protein
MRPYPVVGDEMKRGPYLMSSRSESLAVRARATTWASGTIGKLPGATTVTALLLQAAAWNGSDSLVPGCSIG